MAMLRSEPVASLGLCGVMAVLIGFALWASVSTYRTSAAANASIGLSNLFQEARLLVRVEESLERAYQIEPDEVMWAQHGDAARRLLDTLRKAGERANENDRGLIADIAARQTLYLEIVRRMFGAVDAHDLARVRAIERLEADPAFDDVEAWVDEAARRHSRRAIQGLKALAAIQTRVLVSTPLVFAGGAYGLWLFWRELRRARARVEKALLREAGAVRSSERRLHGLVQNASDMILICDEAGRINFQGGAALTTWGYGADILVGRSLMTMVHPEDRAPAGLFWDQLRAFAPDGPEGQCRRIEARICDEAGYWRPAELIGANLLHDQAVDGMIVTIRDNHEQKAVEQQLTQQAFYDGMTGLPNRVLFRDRLEQALVRARRRGDGVGVVFLDLDNFKLINDGLGHPAGDRLLIEAAARLRLCVRAQDTVARLSGDEFVVVLEMLSGERDALTVARAIEHQFARPFVLNGRNVTVTASMGIAFSDGPGCTAEQVLRKADVAMYRAKASGRARAVVFEPHMDTDSLARLEMENDLRRALELGQMRVHYQPIVHMATGQFTEVEALVRWVHPTRGLVFPNEFIPMAEETGLIVPLGLWVLNEAARQVVVWEEGGQTGPLSLSVNLSPRQFQQPSLVSDVAGVLYTTGLRAERLKLEITEGVIMQNTEATIRTMWELKELGLQLAIDDFGTGYSSLSYLKRLPLDVLKIDRSFVNGIARTPEDGAIVQAIMALAKSLNLQVTGEGIETVEQSELLKSWGCHRGQGYLYGRPLDPEQAVALLAKGRDMHERPRSPAMTHGPAS